MKLFLSLLLCAVSLLSLKAETQPVIASADADYAAYEALDREPSPGEPKEIGFEKYLRWQDAHQRTVTAAAWVFYAAHPTDPRRWTLVMRRIDTPGLLFIKEFGPDVATNGAAAIIRDQAAIATWHRQCEVFMQALLASTDASPKLREKAEWYGISMDLRAAAAARARGEAYDSSGFRARFDAHLAKHAQMEFMIYRATEYIGIMESILPGSGLGIWKHLVDAPDAAVREMATEKVAFLELTSTPMEIAFTAVDGRPVDLKTLRGKVVLIDFWATWCEPCKEEIPNVVANYRKYHDQGFEVVGVSLEDARLSPNDAPEQTTAKLTKAKQVLLNFVATHDMPWPQYFDGKVKQNAIGLKYSVKFIPAMFLLDQQGMLVSTNARGELLEKEVRRLLKL